MLNTVGFLAMLASLTIVLLGLPAQIVNNYRRKSCEGMDQRLIYSVSITYLLWGIYGAMKPDWFLFASQIPGFALCVVLIYQLFRYKKQEGRR